ncbi:ABC transporter substrate-binding protein [Streptomyces sp. NBC_00201]|uniref:ABC transporter substrate-binding protein n=1 Tax=unclassified Streptomyces TaxID=2593676 RepID=UPI0022557E8A|nr:MULTISPECIES: ABC transporter substrate-binding protein [unclassified Streptomyces]MCX5250689.1 ABC transporter substrate-binding protein [Streptomyces sp. NBC_00201]MCX5291382.1 ABC transporter substrate-binding protein [Streptomyces sp. NBC_00183]
MRKPRRRLIAGLLLAPLLTGCFASNQDDSSSSGSSGSGEGARLRVALAFAPTEHYSPYGQDAFIMSRLDVSEGLTKLDANGTAIPSLAESWSSDKGDRSWVFTLRHATFQDGTEVTAEAVASALAHAARAEPAPTALTGVKLTARAEGKNRVRVDTGTADPVLPLRLSNPSLAIFSPKAYEKNGTVNPVGTATGPFEITKITGDTAATLSRFDDYWDGLAQAPGIDVQFIADGTARANALRTGQMDIAQAIPVSQLASLDKDTVHDTDTARDTSLYLNTKSGPFTDPGLRAAAREAIGTSVIAKQVYEGYAEPAQGLFGPALPWTSGKRVAPTGRTKATNPDGKSITIATYSTRPELPEVAQVLQQELEKAGFKVKLVVRSDSQVESDMLAGKYDAAVTSRNMMLDTGDPVSVLASDFTCRGTYNLSQLCDKNVDRLVAAAQAEPDTGRRQDAVMKAEAAVLGTDAVIPLVHVKAVLGIAKSVQDALFSWDERQYVGTGTRR